MLIYTLCIGPFRRNSMDTNFLNNYLKGHHYNRATTTFGLFLKPVSRYVRSSIISTSLRNLEACQNECLRRIFGGFSRSSFKVMLHLVNQPSMRERIAILQTYTSQWYKLTMSPLWCTCVPSADTMDTRTFKHLLQTFLQNNLEPRRDGPNSKLLSACRPTLTVDPILWPPMSYIERSRTLRWRLG
ncbi:MAG: hypothetical protein EXX96DRAFT_602126 [Benjaminiella poitrasii]|nr:MAG: hypothetical protein EXX96DRAFT_602126 [Benjaminiella poitrasii]